MIGIEYADEYDTHGLFTTFFRRRLFCAFNSNKLILSAKIEKRRRFQISEEFCARDE